MEPGEYRKRNMKTKTWTCLRILTLFAFAQLACQSRAADSSTNPGYHLIKQIHIGGDGRWDYLQVDEQGRRLYVTHGDEIVVVDLDSDKVVGEIKNTPGVHGFAPVHDYGVGFSSNGKENKLSMVDLKTFATRDRIKAGKNPDAIIYDSGGQQIYAFNHGGNSVTILEGDDGDPVTTTALPGMPESATVDSKAGRVYCNLEDKDAVAVINAISHRVLTTWSVAPGKRPCGMAIDTAHHRLFIGCRGSRTMVMMDSTDGKVLGSVSTGAGVDANAFDPGRNWPLARMARAMSPSRMKIHRTSSPWCKPSPHNAAREQWHWI